MDFVPDDLQRLARFWGTERLAQTPGLTAVELFAAIGRGEVKAVWIMGTNPVVSLPDSHAVSQALAACPLVVHSAPTPPSSAAIFFSTASQVGLEQREYIWAVGISKRAPICSVESKT